METKVRPVRLSHTFGCWLSIVLATSFCGAQIGDFNSDGMYDCTDVGSLEAAISAGTFDPMYDISNDDVISYDDLHSWLRVAGDSLGRTFESGDANLDGTVNYLDINIIAITFNQLSDGLGWCRGDFNGDGTSDNSDKGLWTQYYNFSDDPNRLAATLQQQDVVPLTAWSGLGAVVATTDRFEIVAIPEAAPDGFFALTLAFRQNDPSHRFTAVEGLEITGDLHQAWLSGPFGQPTVNPPQVGEAFHESWVPYDSHLLITSHMVGFSVGLGSPTEDGRNRVSPNWSAHFIETPG